MEFNDRLGDVAELPLFFGRDDGGELQRQERHLFQDFVGGARFGLAVIVGSDPLQVEGARVAPGDEVDAADEFDCVSGIPEDVFGVRDGDDFCLRFLFGGGA